MEFNFKLLLEDLEKKDSFEKTTFLTTLMTTVKNEKMRLIKKQDFENAADMKDIEIKIIKFIDDLPADSFPFIDIVKLTLEKYISNEKKEV